MPLPLYLAVSPREISDAAQFACPKAYAAYRIGPDNSLLRQALPLNLSGGLLLLSDREAPPVPDPPALSAALRRECRRWGFSGAVLDFEGPPRADLQALAKALAGELPRQLLLTPEAYAVPGGTVLLNSAISGGDFRQYLQDGHQHWGQAALDLQRLRMDFPLPCPSGEGRPLTQEALDALLQDHPSIFFSQELCARYFTSRKGGETRFVLFDDAETLRRKLRIAQSCGISTAICMYPEVRDLLPQLFPQRQPRDR